jgi:hypothetical protein
MPPVARVVLALLLHQEQRRQAGWMLGHLSKLWPHYLHLHLRPLLQRQQVGPHHQLARLQDQVLLVLEQLRLVQQQLELPSLAQQHQQQRHLQLAPLLQAPQVQLLLLQHHQHSQQQLSHLLQDQQGRSLQWGLCVQVGLLHFISSGLLHVPGSRISLS